MFLKNLQKTLNSKSIDFIKLSDKNKTKGRYRFQKWGNDGHHFYYEFNSKDGKKINTKSLQLLL